MKKLIIAFAGLALAVACAETHRITLNAPSVIKGTQLKAGDYKLDVKESSVVLVRGDTRVEVPVKVETVDKKNDGTTVIYSHENGKHIVRAIKLGGTKTKLLFDDGVAAGGGE